MPHDEGSPSTTGSLFFYRKKNWHKKKSDTLRGYLPWSDFLWPLGWLPLVSESSRAGTALLLHCWLTFPYREGSAEGLSTYSSQDGHSALQWSIDLLLAVGRSPWPLLSFSIEKRVHKSFLLTARWPIGQKMVYWPLAGDWAFALTTTLYFSFEKGILKTRHKHTPTLTAATNSQKHDSKP